jgi:hypothetical protein
MAFKYWCLSRTYQEPHPSGEGFQICERKCEHCNHRGEVITQEKDDFICPHTEELMKLAGEVVSGIIGPKLTENQIVADRRKRSNEDFKKNILPTLDKDSKRHHIKKDSSLKKHI